MENNELFTKKAEEALGSLSLSDKLMAAGIISGNESYFYSEENALTDSERAELDLLLLKQMILNGPKGVEMAVRVGKARKASIENPIKKSTGVAQRLKDKIKEWLQ